jgi:oligopeptide/dipeptide ABC transporter ATP-binding protein
MLALVGETGSGKTMAALSVPRLLPPGARIGGSIALHGTELTTLPDEAMRRLRGPAIGVVFQDPAAALNPSHRVGDQIAEAIALHAGGGRRAAWDQAVARLEEVGIADAARRARDYPHQFSGGQRQRVTIALALACDPALLIADECTTGLDPVLARQILDLLAGLRRSRDMAVLFVTHDLLLARRHADTIQVLYAGQSVEHGPAAAVLARPLHPYTAALLASAPSLTHRPAAAIGGMAPEPERRGEGCRFAPRCVAAQPVCTAAPPPWSVRGPAGARCVFAGQMPLPHMPPIQPSEAPKSGEILTVKQISVQYAPRLRGGRPAPAVRGVSLDIRDGECLGIVGASGSGKTSLARAVLQMLPYDGQVALWGTPVGGLPPRPLRMARRRMQVVFQDPASSLNPTMTVGELVAEPLLLAGIAPAPRRERAAALLAQMGLAETLLDRLPGSLSGGQAQRVAVARALSSEPDLVVLDEPTSGLDVSTQAGLLILLRQLLATRRMAYLFITHDLAAARFLSHRIAVMEAGELVEVQEAEALVRWPMHPAARALVEAYR